MRSPTVTWLDILRLSQWWPDFAVGPGGETDGMRAHLLGLVLKQRIQLPIALVAPHRDEYFVSIPNGDDLGLAAGQRTLHFELRRLGQQVAADVKDRRIGLGAGLARASAASSCLRMAATSRDENRAPAADPMGMIFLSVLSLRCTSISTGSIRMSHSLLPDGFKHSAGI